MPWVALFCCDCQLIGPTGELLHGGKTWHAVQSTLTGRDLASGVRTLSDIFHFSHCFTGYTVRREAYQQLNGMDQSLFPLDDYDFMLRLAGRGCGVYYSNEVLALRRDHDVNCSGFRNSVKVCRKKLECLRLALSAHPELRHSDRGSTARLSAVFEELAISHFNEQQWGHCALAMAECLAHDPRRLAHLTRLAGRRLTRPRGIRPPVRGGSQVSGRWTGPRPALPRQEPTTTPGDRMTSLYICYQSVLDPLTQTQVVAYLEGLARAGHQMLLLTFEPRPLGPGEERTLREALRAKRVQWFWLRYHKRPTVPATAWDVAAGVAAGLRLIRRHRVDLVHARVHVPGLMAVALKRLTGVKLLFDIRGLMAEEYVDAGQWKEGGILFRAVKRLEKSIMGAADGVVILTHEGKRLITGWYSKEAATKPVITIPCCVDLRRFPPPERAAGRRRRRRHPGSSMSARPAAVTSRRRCWISSPWLGGRSRTSRSTSGPRATPTSSVGGSRRAGSGNVSASAAWPPNRSPPLSRSARGPLVHATLPLERGAVPDQARGVPLGRPPRHLDRRDRGRRSPPGRRRRFAAAAHRSPGQRPVRRGLPSCGGVSNPAPRRPDHARPMPPGGRGAVPPGKRGVGPVPPDVPEPEPEVTAKGPRRPRGQEPRGDGIARPGGATRSPYSM